MEEAKKTIEEKKKFSRVCGKILGDKSNDSLEDTLELSDNADALQRHRLVEHSHTVLAGRGGRKIRACPDSFEARVAHYLYFTEEDLREVVQEELSIKSDPEGYSRYEYKLGPLNKTYWLLTHKWAHYYNCLTDGPQRRGFDFWRSDPKWYMHQLLKEDCARKNGCCARGCGCCGLREPSPSRTLGVGHCTLECGCCKKAHGFTFLEGEKKSLKELCREQMLALPRHRIIRVATWGLVGDCHESPFAMIDAPPSYKKEL